MGSSSTVMGQIFPSGKSWRDGSQVSKRGGEARLAGRRGDMNEYLGRKGRQILVF